ncbi:MAG: aldo/keto reductase [Clostridia bacterium]|nr:aldo/keto reductase [Clostridia bacterium]
MKHRTLGKAGLSVSAIGLSLTHTSRGGLPFQDKRGMSALIHRAVEMGENFFDTSELYDMHGDERLAGEALEPFRDEVVIAAKFDWRIGARCGRDGGLSAMRRSLEDSLRRLRTDRIDLYYQDGVDPDVPIEDVAQTVSELKKEGKVLHWGLSHAGVCDIRRAHAICPVTAVRGEYSLWVRRPESDLLPALEETGIGFVSSNPIGMGFLADSPEDTRLSESSNPARNHMDELRAFAAAREITPSQVALAWLLCQKPWIVPVPGTKKEEHLQEYMSAAYVELSAADMIELNAML